MRNILIFSLLSLACTLGCGKQGFNVGGKVTFSDGKPLTQGQVMFTSGFFTAGGGIISDGSYSMSVRIPAGTYKVSVVAVGEPIAAPSGNLEDMKPGKPLVDPKFSNPETSGFVCEVKGPTGFNITVEPPK